MSRRNRGTPAAWEQLWQIFCPWVAGIDDSISLKPARTKSKPSARSKNLRAILIGCACLSLWVAKPVKAANEDDGQFMQISLVKPAETPMASYPEIFGHGEKRYDDLKPFTKWSGVLARFADQFQEGLKYKSTRDWLAFLKEAQNLDPIDQIEAVNTYMNKVPFIEDKDNYNVSDYWATPMQFLRRGGDCEDYAIAKYVSLRALGFKEEQLRIAIVYDTVLRMPHAVLIAYEDDKGLVLDNQSKEVKSADNVKQYAPIYSINQYAWWRH